MQEEESKAELKPCAHHGKPAELVQCIDGFYSIRCEDGCDYRLTTGGLATVDELVIAWNARAERTCKMIESEDIGKPFCSRCFTTIRYNDVYCPNCGAKVVD